MYEHHDLVIVGAGISGISSAVHVQKALPGKDYLILEKRQAIGGTWDLFRYPGVRSDSDMFTLGFDFKPWEDDRAIAPGSSIRDYLQEAARENHVEEHVRYGHKVIAAEWDSTRALWTLTAEVADGEPIKLTANFVHFASGYYSYEEPYRPEFPGEKDFKGTLIHPQHWPEDLDYADKRVVIIGSGATAVTLTPSMADTAAHVTMLQRSPSYILSLPGEDELANRMRKVLPRQVAYQLTRGLHVALTYGMYQYLRHRPEQGKAFIRKIQARQLPEDYPIDVNFKPRYEPWDERLCLVPDGDLFKSLRRGTSSIVTGVIDTFTETGIRLTTGEELEADIIVTATGLSLQLLGGAHITVDGETINLIDLVTYKGPMFSGVPNLLTTFGYINASWTLKADLVSRFLARTLKYMDKHGYDEALPLRPPAGEKLLPYIDLQSGYVKRGEHLMAKQATRAPWIVNQSYLKDLDLLLRKPIADEGIRFFTRNPGTLRSSEQTVDQLDGRSDLGTAPDGLSGVRG